jgi:hypothetical protein
MIKWEDVEAVMSKINTPIVNMLKHAQKRDLQNYSGGTDEARRAVERHAASDGDMYRLARESAAAIESASVAERLGLGAGPAGIANDAPLGDAPDVQGEGGAPAEGDDEGEGGAPVEGGSLQVGFLGKFDVARIIKVDGESPETYRDRMECVNKTLDKMHQVVLAEIKAKKVEGKVAVDRINAGVEATKAEVDRIKAAGKVAIETKAQDRLGSKIKDARQAKACRHKEDMLVLEIGNNRQAEKARLKELDKQERIEGAKFKRLQLELELAKLTQSKKRRGGDGEEAGGKKKKKKRDAEEGVSTGV